MGIGGAQMASHGFEAWWPSDALAVRGYVEVLRHYRRIVGIRAQLRQRLLKYKPFDFPVPRQPPLCFAGRFQDACTAIHREKDLP